MPISGNAGLHGFRDRVVLLLRSRLKPIVRPGDFDGKTAQLSADVNDEPKSLIKTLTDDVIASNERLREHDTQSNRRDVVRTTFAGIEAGHYYARESFITLAKLPGLLSIHETACLLEETYAVSNQGVVKVQPKYIALPASIKMMAAILKRISPNYNLDLNHSGWSALLRGLKVRNRITHPRSASDLTISDLEINSVMSAFIWTMAFDLEVKEEVNTYLSKVLRIRP